MLVLSPFAADCRIHNQKNSANLKVGEIKEPTMFEKFTQNNARITLECSFEKSEKAAA
jgi:hypothetical protein